MASTFISQFVADAKLTRIESDVFHQVGVRSTEDVDGLVRSFPSIMDVGVRLNVVSNAAARNLNSAYTSFVAAAAQLPTVAMGANPPPNTPFSIGATVGLTAPPTATPPAAPPANIDLRPSFWPVRNQGARGTCVAFAMTGCIEHMRFATEGPNPDYSEQFLYWAIKDHSADSLKSKDGTWLEYARDMLNSDGICRETLCPYTGSRIRPVSGPAPAPTAVSAAAGNKALAGTYFRHPAAAAAKLLALLRRGRPAAISLPVFSDPAVPDTPRRPTNWTTTVGWSYGRVLDPPPRSIVTGGHCVCVTGYVADPAEPAGGYFIIRNSWDIQWAAAAPSPGSLSPEQGYGEVSATYVDSYCWEVLQL